MGCDELELGFGSELLHWGLKAEEEMRDGLWLNLDEGGFCSRFSKGYECIEQLQIGQEW